MNGFYQSIINLFRGIRTQISSNPYFSTRYYTFGTIVSGQYIGFKHDPSPSIFVMYGGEMPSYNQKRYVHGLNIHYMSQDEQQRFLRYVFVMRRAQQIVNPRLLYQYLKLNFRGIIEKCYRMYHLEQCQYKLISPGITNINVDMCYPITDRKDYLIASMNQGMQTPTVISENTERKISYDSNELQAHIIESLNSKPLFLKR